MAMSSNRAEPIPELSCIKGKTPLVLTLDLLSTANRRIHELERLLAASERELAALRVQQANQVFAVAVTLRSGALLDPIRRRLTSGGTEAIFTDREWQVVAYLRQANRPVGREELIELLYAGICVPSAITTIMDRIRKKFRSVGAASDLVNWAGQGGWRGNHNGGSVARYELLLAPAPAETEEPQCQAE
jgi:hypothetical protein